MQLFAFGVNHHTAPLAVREQVTFHAANLEEALRDLVNHESVREAAIISTCNRTEVYCSTPEPERAVKVAERIYPSTDEQNVLFIGAGEMIELCAAHFAAKQPRHATFANRTLERGEELAARFRGQAITLNDMPEQLAMHDIVVSCTASQLPILGKGMIERAIKALRHRPMLMIDLAVTRDVEAEVAEVDDVVIYS